MTKRHYSDLFSCLYDQPAPVGELGRGTHYSVFRSMQWRDIDGDFRDSGRFHDFAVVWDEDHDERVIRFVEQLHICGLLWPVIFIGERKGALTVLLWQDVEPKKKRADFFEVLNELAERTDEDDAWSLDIGRFYRDPANVDGLTTTCGIINDTEDQVVAYLQAIDVLWQLGEKKRVPYRPIVLPGEFGTAMTA